MNGRNVRAAIECQDVLGKYLPQLNAEFVRSRKYLDAAHYIRSVLLPDCEDDSFRPSAIQQTIPIDIIDAILQKNPAAFV